MTTFFDNLNTMYLVSPEPEKKRKWKIIYKKLHFDVQNIVGIRSDCPAHVEVAVFL